MTRLIDASALLAILFEETGGDVAAAHSHRGAISAVNLCEAVQKSAHAGLPAAMVSMAIKRFEIDVVPYTEREAVLAGEMRERPGFSGVSLADRACLATALVRGLSILTADRAWSSLDLPIEIVQIR